MKTFNKSEIMKNAWNMAKRQATKAGSKFLFGSWVEVEEVTAKSIFGSMLRLAWDQAKAELATSKMAAFVRVKTIEFSEAFKAGLQFTNKRFCSAQMVDMGQESACFESQTIVDLI
jgi:hypothetical protein